MGPEYWYQMTDEALMVAEARDKIQQQLQVVYQRINSELEGKNHQVAEWYIKNEDGHIVVCPEEGKQPAIGLSPDGDLNFLKCGKDGKHKSSRLGQIQFSAISEQILRAAKEFFQERSISNNP